MFILSSFQTAMIGQHNEIPEFAGMEFSAAWKDHLAQKQAAAVCHGAVACLITIRSWMPAKRAPGLFTLSLPVSRRKVLLWQALVGFYEIFLVALIVPILLPLIAPLQGQWFSWKADLIYTLTMVLGSSISLILSAVFMFAAVRIYDRRDL